MKLPNRTRGPSAKTPPKLDALYAYICEQWKPPYYEIPLPSALAASIGASITQMRRYLAYLEQDGRMMRSPQGKLVPNPINHDDMMDAIKWALGKPSIRIIAPDPSVFAAYEKYRTTLKTMMGKKDVVELFEAEAWTETQTIDADKLKTGITGVTMEIIPDDGYGNPAIRSTPPTAPAPLETGDGREWLNHRD